MVESMNRPVELESHIAALLSIAGRKARIESIETLTAGGNNRSYRVVTSDNVYVAKQYFSHVGDSRDRLGSEFTFLKYAEHAAPGCAPVALAEDRETGMALYQFVSGRSLRPGEVKLEHVNAAASFFCALNAATYRSVARVPVASEACFSIEEHLSLVEVRLERLQSLEQRVPEDRDARDLLEAIVSCWQDIKVAVHAGALVAGLNITEPLGPLQRCISPSDFGFHNALLQYDGQLRFLDFEYAGWDDPAKMTGDFFSQLAVPVPQEYFDHFAETCLAVFPQHEALMARADLLRPVYQIKWCCIALNVFLPVSLARRKFANPGLDERTLKRHRLVKVKPLLQSILLNDHGLH